MKEKSKSKNDKPRLSLALAQKVRDRLELLQEETGAQTMTEVISRALAVYDYLITEKKSGAKVLLETKDGTREVVILT